MASSMLRCGGIVGYKPPRCPLWSSHHDRAVFVRTGVERQSIIAVLGEQEVALAKKANQRMHAALTASALDLRYFGQQVLL